MTLSRSLRRLEAKRCSQCHGHGHTQGLFHAFPCQACAASGYVQAATGQPIDTLAAAILAGERSQAAASARLRGIDRGSPDNWTLRNRYRGD